MGLTNDQGELAMSAESSFDRFEKLLHNLGRVPLADIGAFLHHRMQMTFTVTILVGWDPSVSAVQPAPNLVNPWGLSESPTSPFWISENGSGVVSIDSVTSSGVTLNLIPPVTVAVPPGQTPGTASPT